MVRVGFLLPTYTPGRDIEVDVVEELAIRAEEAGLDHVFVGDHFVWNVGMLDPISTLGYLARATSRIRLGTAVYLLPLRHPTVTAKQFASLDVISRGRVVLGAGIGGDNPTEYEAVGVPPSARGRRFEEAVAILRHLWRQEDGAFRGEFTDLPDFRLEPAPVQDPVPIWVGGRAEAVVERAARLGEGWFPVWVSARRYGEARQRIDEIRGGSRGFSYALNVFAHIEDSREKAHQNLSAHMESAYQLPFDRFAKYAAFGEPEDLQETLAGYIEAGVTDVVLGLTGPSPQEQASRLLEDLIPWLRSR